MVSSLGILFVTAFAFQTPTVQTANGLRTPTRTAPADPTKSLTPEMRGDIFIARKMYRDAIEVYQQGPKDSPILANKIGIAYHQLPEGLDSAARWYQRAIKLNPQYAEAVNNLGTVYYAHKSYRRAISQYRRALRLTPQSASILSNLGTAYFARKDYKDAFAMYQEALQHWTPMSSNATVATAFCFRSAASMNAPSTTIFLPRPTLRRAWRISPFKTSASRSRKASRSVRSSRPTPNSRSSRTTSNLNNSWRRSKRSSDPLPSPVRGRGGPQHRSLFAEAPGVHQPHRRSAV